jgi:hypothetical protein
MAWPAGGSPAVKATRERRHARGGPTAPALLDPGRDRLRVGPGLAAQLGGLPRERLIELPLRGALQDPSHLGQQGHAPVRELAELGHRRGFLVPGQHAPPGVTPGGAGELRDQDAVTIRTRAPVSHGLSIAAMYGKQALDWQITATGWPGGVRTARSRRYWPPWRDPVPGRTAPHGPMMAGANPSASGMRNRPAACLRAGGELACCQAGVASSPAASSSRRASSWP